MCAAIVHRGPDSRGTFFGEGAGLGIQRLAIIDLDTGDQPICNEDESVVVVLNGEIYNYVELRAELEARRPPLSHAQRHGGDRPPLRGARRRLRPTACAACSPSRSGTVAAAGSSSRATASARSPCSTRTRDGDALVRLGDARRSCRTRAAPRAWTARAIDAYLQLRLRARTRSSAFAALRKLPPAHTLDLAGRRGRRLDRYWRLRTRRSVATTARPTRS